MATWTDRHGKSHTIELDLWTAKRIRDETPVDLVVCLKDPEQIEPQIKHLHADEETLLSVLMVVHEVDDVKAFSQLFDGEAYESAATALLGAIVDFFREPHRSIYRRLLVKMGHQLEAINKMAEAQANEVIETMDLHSVLNQSTTPGNGSSVSSESSTTMAAG